MNPDVVLPLLSSVLSFIFCILLIDQWRVRRRSYQGVWAIGMLWYGLSAGTEFLGGAFGWSEAIYRPWYLIGAVYVAAWLGLGTALLLGRTRFGYAFALSILLAGLFTFLTHARQQYPDAGDSATIYFALGVVLAAIVAVLTYLERHVWAQLVGVVLTIGSVIAAVVAFTVPLPAPGYVLSDTGIPVAGLFPGYLRLLTPYFNITGGFALALGAVFSTYVFMPKRRVLDYSLEPGASFVSTPFFRFDGPRSTIGAIVAYVLLYSWLVLIALVVNFLASIPLAIRALRRGELNSRVPATILLALGGFIPSITSGLNRFGLTGPFFLGELLGVIFLFLGFLASIEVFREFRVPFTNRVLRARTGR